MSARRCSSCDINYPKDKKVCPICDTPTWSAEKEDHDTDWKQKVERYNKRIPPNTYMPLVCPEIIQSTTGELFVGDENLKESGHLDVAVGSVLRLSWKGLPRFFEVYGCVYPETDAQGWWIREIKYEGVFDDAKPEDIIGTQAEA